MELEQPINAYVCQYCKGSFDKLENLSKHVQKIHTVGSSGKENRICPLCGTQCIKIEGYRNHLRHIHGHNEEGQIVLFKSFNDFLVWKNELEKRNYCKYVMREPPKKLSSKDKIHIYRCDSSVGSMKEKKSGVAVRESCPAVITAIESVKTKGIKIEHWNSHVGHIIPVEEDELDAAIGSLGTTEIVLTTDQRYQYEGQNADGNIFFITESNDGSLTETFVRESPKKSNLFQNTKIKLSESFSKPTSQKFSYKKDPTKKSGSFSYSLASVACMKPSAKKKIIAPLVVTTTSSEADSVNTTITDSTAVLPTQVSSVASTEIELATESIIDAINSSISSRIDTPVKSNDEEAAATLISPSKNLSVTNAHAITNQTFEFINDGSLSGQVVVLNSLPGQNSNQNILLSSDQKFISLGPPISVETLSSKKGKGSKKYQKKNPTPQIIVIPTASDKENALSVEDLMNLPPIPIDNIITSPGPSILRKAKKTAQKSPQKRFFSAIKNISVAEKSGISSVKKTIPSGKKLCMGLNPTLDVTVMEVDEPAKSTTKSLRKNLVAEFDDVTVKEAVASTLSTNDSVAKIVEITDSSLSEVNNSTPNTSSNFLSGIQDTVSDNPSLIADSAIPSTVKISVSSDVENSFSSSDQSLVSSSFQCAASPVTQRSVSPTTQRSVSPPPEHSISPPPEHSVSPTTERSISPTIEQSISPTIERSVSPTTEHSVSPNTQHSVSPTTQHSVSPTAEYPVSPTTQISASPCTQSSVSPATFVSPPTQSSVSPATQISVSSAIQNSASPATQTRFSSAIQTSLPSSIPNNQPINPVFLNSFPPGQTFMSINNSLIPIGSPTAPLLPSNFNPGFVLASPVPPFPIARPVRHMPYSRMPSRPPRTSLPPVRFSDKKTPYKQTGIRTPTRQKAPFHASPVPLFMIPNSGSPIGPSVPFPSPLVTSNVNSTLSSPIRSAVPRPLISNRGAPVFTQLAPGTRLITSPIFPNIPAAFLNNNRQQISRPMLQNIPLLTATGQQVSRSMLQNNCFAPSLIGQPAVAPRPIISTTVSNAIKVQKVQLPFCTSTVTNPNMPVTSIAGLTSTHSEATKVSSVVLNTEPISSTPTINIPPLATSISSHKPGSVIFESQGDVYMLEPVEENSQTNSSASVKNVSNKLSIAVPSTNGITKSNNSDEVRESTLEGNKSNFSSLLKEKPMGSQSIFDTRVEGRVKSLSPRKSTDIKNGVQIKSVVQEKRHLKDDDVEILKKVKYYQMEMKYLSSQAECKRLKLELARAQMKNKEIIKSNSDSLSSEISMKENDNEGALVIDTTSHQDNLELKHTSGDEKATENTTMGVDNASNEAADETAEDQATDIQNIDKNESTNQSDADSSVSNHGGDLLVESGDLNGHDNSPVDYGDSNCGDNSSGNSNCGEASHTDYGDSNQSNNITAECEASNDNCLVDESTKKEHIEDSLENQSSSDDLDDMNCDNESDDESNLETSQEALNKEFQTTNTLENKSINFTPCNDSNKQFAGIDKSTLLDESFGNKFHTEDESLNINEIEESFKTVETDQQSENYEITDVFKVQESAVEQMHMPSTLKSESNNFVDQENLGEHIELDQPKNASEKSMDLDDYNNSGLEEDKNLLCDKSELQETLKELEFQYGGKESVDIYTMIRTSVLRSLYDDMKILCEENKKLYERLQNSRSPKESCETDNLCS